MITPREAEEEAWRQRQIDQEARLDRFVDRMARLYESIGCEAKAARIREPMRRVRR